MTGERKEKAFEAKSLYAGTGQDSGFPFLNEGTDPEIGEDYRTISYWH